MILYKIVEDVVWVSFR